jgi:hypothetical protein
MDKTNENLLKVVEHWELAAKRLLSYETSVFPDVSDEMLKACDETAAIVLEDCATELRRVLAGGEPTLDMSPEEKLLRAIEAKS